MAFIGTTDLPAQEDQFGIEKYRDSMVQFIENCNTPMTISIQGTWGTGKTSFMKMVSEKLTKCKYIEFNTWQFSQFEMDENLSQNLIKSLIDDMGLSKDQKKGINIAVNSARLLSSIAFEKLTGIGNAGSAAGEMVQKLGDVLAGDDGNNPIKAVKEIKKQFERCIEDCKKNNNVDRVVIFIDDLDRLEPRKAVELLEILKNFLDCEDCVFVLAIDYDVVCKGVAIKYGEYNSAGVLDSKKGKDFFDKIIQVPFKMPVAQYDMQKYLMQCMKGITNNGKPLFNDNEDMAKYYVLVRDSIGTNPRAIKRLINSYQLLVMVVSLNEGINITDCKLELFATLCLQELDAEVYNTIVRDREYLSNDKLKAFVNADKEMLENYYPKLKIEDGEEGGIDLDKVSAFILEMIEIIDKNGDGELSKDEIQYFAKLLNYSSITSTGDNGGKTDYKRAQSIIGDEIHGFRFNDNTGITPDQIERLLETLSSISEDVQLIGKIGTSNPYIRLVKGEVVLADIVGRKGAVAAETYFCGMTIGEENRIPEDIKDLIRKHKKNGLVEFSKTYGGGNCIYPIVFDFDSLDEMIKMLSYAEGLI